jgi:DNA primase
MNLSSQTSHSKIKQLLFVEGYTDVIQFNQSGIENVVASSGLDARPNSFINRLTKNITVLFDGDAAGLRFCGIDLILKKGYEC